jgi:ribonuclease P protein component
MFFHDNGQKKVAFVAGKKVGNAVARNKAKRHLRAHFIKYSSRLKDGTYILVAKAKVLSSNYATTENNFNGALKKLNAFQSLT